MYIWLMYPVSGSNSDRDAGCADGGVSAFFSPSKPMPKNNSDSFSVLIHTIHGHFPSHSTL
jgi:hypothetical protein